MKIQVRVKIKPEKDKQDNVSLSSMDNTIYLHKENEKDKDHTFRFQNVLNLSKIESENQKIEMFEKSKNNLVKNICDNYSQLQDSCFISYGQKGSGKSYEIFGGQSNNNGIFQDILSKFVADKHKHEIFVKMFVISNKDIFDILSNEPNKNQNFKIRYNQKQEEFMIENLINRRIDDVQQIQDIVNKKKQLKKRGIFQEQNIVLQIEIFRLNKTSNQIFLIDLEGSNLNENNLDNKSKTNLFYLRKLFIDLKNGTNIIDFRQSILTKLIKKFFQGRGRIWMSFSISPDLNDYKMTKFNLKYALMVQQIVLKPQNKARRSLKVIPTSQYQILYNAKFNEEKKQHNIQTTFSLQNIPDLKTQDEQIQEKFDRIEDMFRNKTINLDKFLNFDMFFEQHFYFLTEEQMYDDFYNKLNFYYQMYQKYKKREIIKKVKQENAIKVQKYMCKIVYKKEIEFSIFDDSEKLTLTDYLQGSLIPIENFIKVKVTNLTDGKFTLMSTQDFKNYCKLTTKHYNYILENSKQKFVQMQFANEPIRVLFGSIDCKNIFLKEQQQIQLQSRYSKQKSFSMQLQTQNNCNIKSIEKLSFQEVKGMRIQIVFNCEIEALPQFYDVEPQIIVYCKNTNCKQFVFEKFQSKLNLDKTYTSTTFIYKFNINTDQDLQYLKFNRIKFEIWSIPQFSKILQQRPHNENLENVPQNQIEHQSILNQSKKPQKPPTPLGKKIKRKSKKSLCTIF